MKIASSDIQLQGNYSATQLLERQESKRAWVGGTRPDFEGLQQGLVNRPTTPVITPAVSGATSASGLVKLSDAGISAQTQEAQAIEEIDKDLLNDPRYALIKYMVELFTGRKITVFNPAELKGAASSTSGTDIQDAAFVAQANSVKGNKNKQALPPAPKPVGWGVEIDRRSSYTETEQSNFQASGTIVTADNKKIEFSINFDLKRSFHEESSEQIRLGDAKKIDPLVLNFSGNSAQLTSTKFSFDLDADGTKDNISFVKGAGFLVLDKDADGKINDGTELFGPATGNGFAELAAYDSDGNSWIDENDAIYSKLQVWTKDVNGKDQLQSLKEANVGAIYLDNISTPFELKNKQNQSDGQIRSSSIWLTEDYQVKTVQQIDLAV